MHSLEISYGPNLLATSAEKPNCLVSPHSRSALLSDGRFFALVYSPVYKGGNWRLRRSYGGNTCIRFALYATICAKCLGFLEVISDRIGRNVDTGIA